MCRGWSHGDHHTHESCVCQSRGGPFWIRLRAAIYIPTPRQQGLEAPADRNPSPNWTWARLLKRVFAIDMARCPGVSRAGCGSLRRLWKEVSSRKSCGM